MNRLQEIHGARLSFRSFTLNLIGAVILMIIADIALVVALGRGLPTGMSAVMPPLMAALACGQRFAKDYGGLPSRGEAWRIAFGGVVLFVGISLIQFAIGMAIDPAIKELMAKRALIVAVSIFAALVFLLDFFLIPVFIRMGAKGVLKKRLA